MSDHLASSLEQVTARAWGLMYWPDLRHRHLTLTSDIDIGHRWSGRDNGPRKRGPINNMR